MTRAPGSTPTPSPAQTPLRTPFAATILAGILLAVGCGEGSSPAPTPAPRLPAAPTGLTVIAATRTNVELSWNEVGTSSAFEVEQRVAGGAWTRATCNLVPLTTNRCIVPGLGEGTTYEFRVRNFRSRGGARRTASGWSVPIRATTRANRAPRARANIPDRTVIEKEDEVIDVARIFADPDGDALTHTAASSRENVVAVRLSGSEITLVGIAPGSATVTLTATDAGGMTAEQSFEVTVVIRFPFELLDLEWRAGDRTLGAIPVEMTARLRFLRSIEEVTVVGLAVQQGGIFHGVVKRFGRPATLFDVAAGSSARLSFRGELFTITARTMTCGIRITWKEVFQTEARILRGVTCASLFPDGTGRTAVGQPELQGRPKTTGFLPSRLWPKAASGQQVPSGNERDTSWRTRIASRRWRPSKPRSLHGWRLGNQSSRERISR